jgi:hypothetical protein
MTVFEESLACAGAAFDSNCSTAKQFMVSKFMHGCCASPGVGHGA